MVVRSKCFVQYAVSCMQSLTTDNFRFDINFDLNSDGLADRGETQAFFARVRSKQ